MPEITRYAQGTPSWVELTTTDDTEAVKFYGSLFGWVNDPQEMGPGSYYHMQQLEGLAAAAIYKMGDEERAQNVPPHWKTYFTVTNTDEAVERAKEAGGSVVAGPFDVFTAGRMALLQDRQGAMFAIWQPKAAYRLPGQGRPRRAHVERAAHLGFQGGPGLLFGPARG